MRQIRAKIVSNEKVTSSYYKMVIYAPSIAKEAKPGQFIHVKCSDGVEPLLRRPFSVHRIRRGGLEILYKVIGQGTGLLSKKMNGEAVDIIGPLGNGFGFKRGSGGGGRRAILIAGGIGIAPLVFLAEKLMGVKNQKPKSKNLVLIGARTEGEILCEKEFKKLGCRVKISTDDGSRGFKGRVTDLLRALLLVTSYPSASLGTGELLVSDIYACGPVPMLRDAAKIAHQHKIPCQVSLEERMACGLGVCLGCPVKVNPVSPDIIGTNGGKNIVTHAPVHEPFTSFGFGTVRGSTGCEYKMVCKDGPVFDAERVII